MKNLILLLLFTSAFYGCREKPSPIREEAINEIAENASKDLDLMFLMEHTLPLAKLAVKSARHAVEIAETPSAIALAVEDLRAANAEVADVERRIKEVQ